MIEIVNNNNELLLKLVNDVLEISRLDSGNLSFDIKEHNITKIIKGDLCHLPNIDSAFIMLYP
jgi:signal transduction histidine kinase